MRSFARFSVPFTAVLVGLSLFGTSAAFADNSVDVVVDTDEMFVEPGFVVTNETLVATENGLFRAEVSKSDPTEIAAGASARCGWTNAVAVPGAYRNSSPGCAIFGFPGYQNVTEWQRAWFAGGTPCVQVRGFTSTGSTQWNVAGCGAGQAKTYSWGNAAAHVLIRTMSASGHNVALNFR